MDIATTMAAVNYFNMVNTWNMLAMQDTEPVSYTHLTLPTNSLV